MDNKLLSKIKEINPNLTKEEKISEIKKILEEKNEPELVIIKDIKEVLTKLADILGVVSNIENQDVKTYEEELQNLVDSISELKETITDKDMVVNIPLDDLASSISRVETAVKNIKFPEIPETVVNEVSFKDDEIIDAIKKIPQFPIEDIKKMFVGITEMLSSTPEFNYERLERKLDSVIKAIGKIDLSVYGGGGNSYLRNAKSDIINPATEEGLTELKSVLEEIKTNTANINVNVGDVDINTDELEGKTNVMISNQNTMKSLIETLQELSSRLVVLSAVRGISADLRVTPLSTPNMSTLTTLTNQTNAGGYALNTQIPNANNMIAVLSNINNISTV